MEILPIPAVYENRWGHSEEWLFAHPLLVGLWPKFGLYSSGLMSFHEFSDPASPPVLFLNRGGSIFWLNRLSLPSERHVLLPGRIKACFPGASLRSKRRSSCLGAASNPIRASAPAMHRSPCRALQAQGIIAPDGLRGAMISHTLLLQAALRCRTGRIIIWMILHK